MSTQANPIVDQAGVNAAADFDTAALGTLGIDAGSFPETEAKPEGAQAASADAGNAGAGAGEKTATDGSQAAAAGTEKKGDQQQAVAAVQADEWAIDQAVLDRLFADPTHGAFAKTLHEKYVKAVESAKIWGPEANEARALVPGGLPELKETVEIAQSARKEAADFASGDPARQKTALASIAEEHPEQFVAGMPLYLEMAAQKNPQAYAAHMKGELSRSLQADGVIDAMAALFAASKAAAGKETLTPEDERAFAEPFQLLSQWFEKAGFQAGAKPATAKDGGKKVDPELAAAQAKIKEYEERDAAAKKMEFQTAFNSWWEPTWTAVSTGVREAAKERLEEFLPTNIEKSFREFTMNQLLDKVEAEIGQQLEADLGHQEKLGAIMKGDTTALKGEAWKQKGEETRTQYVNLQVGRAKQLLARTVEKIMKNSGRTQQAVDAAAVKTGKEKAAAATADVTGSGGNARPKPWTVKDVRSGGALANKSEEEILEM